MSEAQPNQDQLNEVNTILDTIYEQRARMTISLQQQLAQMPVTDQDSPKMAEAKASLITALNTLWSAQEKNATTKAKLKLSNKETETNINVKDSIIELLNRIAPNQVRQRESEPLTDNHEELQQLSERNQFTFTEDELDLEGEHHNEE